MGKIGKVNVGIIGCGKFAMAQHLPNCVAAENMELFHCSSIDERDRKNAEQFCPKKVTADYRDVLNDPEVDMVIVAVPHEWHKFYLEEAVKSGKHVFCEKPMTLTLDDAYDVIKLVRRHNVKLCVDYNRRFSPAMVDMKRAYHAHKTDPQGRTRVYLQEPNRQIWTEELQTMFTIRINDESRTYGGVHIDWKEGGGLVIGEGCHWLDLMCWMLEERPIRLTAIGSTRLNHVITIEFDRGAIGCLIFGVAGTFEWPKELLELQHRGKIFRSECFVENHYFGLGERTVKMFPLQQDPQPQVGNEGGLHGYLAKIDAAGTEYESTGVYNTPLPDKGHSHLLQAFADAILRDGPSPINEMTGMRATYLSLRAMQSIRQNISLPVNTEDWEMYVH
jgi:predicted dehydrogenase